ncbi:type II toxin-antitoxin system ParD family antitoxin [Blastomonas sp.]|uniref:type II toxin-antitoxin system ParD family antitoxin n=1 Tax=Blastomonas sp. TaxID=1909299 RepID=UPI003593D159
MNISLPDEMKAFVDAQVATGMYANASDFIRDLIRNRAEERDEAFAVERLDDLLEQGLASGITTRSLEQIVAEARMKYRCD